MNQMKRELNTYISVPKVYDIPVSQVLYAKERFMPDVDLSKLTKEQLPEVSKGDIY